jgi:D-alanine-D-alanine ligase-like ATP-grasp enzyme
VVREAWRLDPLAWIHRAEARAIARELDSKMVAYRQSAVAGGKLLLRLSDPVMREALRELKVPYCGPGRAALERCYDKYEAQRIVVAGGLDAPRTLPADAKHDLRAPFVVKPRWGSDSIGVRVAAAIPARRRNADHLVQELVLGEEFTVAVFRDRAGAPLRIFLPPGTPYSFLRKYFWRPRRAPVEDGNLRETALRAARLLGVDWAARVDLMRETATGRLCFLECDAAPLVGPASAFAASFAAAGVDRATQLRWLLEDKIAA